MNIHNLVALGCLVAITNVALADAQYQESTQITGGQLVDTVKSIPFGQKRFQKMFAPISTQKMLHGNQLASVSTTATEIIDLDEETITHIDSDKKTYSVTTFAQMRQAVQDATKKMDDAQAKAKQSQKPSASTDNSPASQLQVTYEVAVTDTGVTKPVNGINAKEQLLTMKAHVTDPNAAASSGPTTVTYTYIADIWTAPEPPEMKQIAEFYMRYGKKLMQGVDTTALMKSMKPALSGAAMAPLFASNPSMGPALQEMMAKMATEMQKIKGTTILEIARFGGDGLTAASGTASAASGNAPTSAAADTSSDSPSTASKLGALGAAFGKSMLGTLHHGSDSSSPASANAPAASNVALYESTTQKSAFSQEPVPALALQIPAGYAKVESSYERQLAN